MKKINIHDAKTNLSKYLENGDSFVICKNHNPVAKVLPLKKKKKRIGLAKGDFTIPNSFFDPLPKDIESLFNK